MSTGSAAIPLLKAAPDPGQLAERLEGGPWGGIELCLRPADVRDDDAVAAGAEAVRRSGWPAAGAVLAEAPVAWPSGAFVRVDTLDDEAADGLRRSAAFAAAVGSPVLTLHLFVPQDPQDFRHAAPLDDEAIERCLRTFAGACAEHGVQPLLENVPPILRMRTGGVFLSRIGGHWRDLLAWRERVPELGITLDTSHAALFRSFCLACPAAFGVADPEELALDRFVAELAPALRVAHVSNAAGVLGEGLPYEEGELELDPVAARLGASAEWIVAEINEPDPARSPLMKAGHRALEAALAQPPRPWRRPVARLLPDAFDWQEVLRLADPVPAVLELEERFAGRRVAITGGAGSIGRGLATLLGAFRPSLVALLDTHEASLTADRRARGAAALTRVEHVLADVRDRDRVEAELTRVAPDVVFHLAAYKHVDWAERYPEEFAATNLDGSWNVLRAAERVGASTVVVASTDKAALATSRYGRSKRLMEALAGVAAERSGAQRAAVRLVNVLGSAGSASELFLRQARAGVPLTVTDTGMRRFWISPGHAATLVAHAALAAGGGARVVTAADPVELSVGDLAERIWTAAGREGAPVTDVLGVRPGEVMAEVLTGGGEQLEPERFAGCAEIRGAQDVALAGELVRRLEAEGDARERRAAWTAALDRPLALAGGVSARG
jgi:nucleoside-diphosphate-sugar epimerase